MPTNTSNNSTPPPHTFPPILSTLTLISLILSIPLSSWAQEEEFPTGGEPTIDDSRCETPDVLLLLDRSGSMLNDMKWEQATTAVEQTFSPYFETLRFGLLPFPTENACGVVDTPLAIEVGEASEADLTSIFEASLPEDEALTPLADAINAGRRALDAVQQPDRRGFLILFTDGLETCAPEELEDTAPVEAARLAADAGYSTYVIGFGSLVRRRILNQMAEVGGTGEARLVSDLPALETTFNEIIESATIERCDLLDNDCDGRIDEGADCAPPCYPEAQECPCTNNRECNAGEMCSEGLCAPIPCDLLCDQGYICRAEECIPFEVPPETGGAAVAGSNEPAPMFGGAAGGSPAEAGTFGGAPATNEMNADPQAEPSTGCQQRADLLSLGSYTVLFMLFIVRLYRSRSSV